MPEQAQDNPIYKFMKSNNLTQLDEKAFLDKYSAPEKAKEIHSFMVSNKLTDLDDTKFYDKYLKKKDQAVTLSVSSPTQSLSPDFKKGKAFAEKGFLMQAEGTKAPKKQKISIEPSLSLLGMPKIKVLEEDEDPSILADFTSSALKGQIQGKVANILSAGKRPTPEELGEIAQLQTDLQALPQSKAEKVYQEKGLKGLFMDSPGLGVQFIAETMASSLSSLFEASKRTVPAGVAMGAAAGAPFAGIGALPGAATGFLASQSAAGYNISTSQDILNSLSENGVDISNKESLINAFSNEKKMAKIRNTAAKYGVPILLFDVATAGVAGKLGAGAIGKSLNKKLLAGLGEAGIQMTGGAGGELAGQIASGKKVNWDDVAVEAIAQVPGGAVEVATGIALERSKTSSNNKTLATQIATQGVQNGTEDAVINLNRDLANNVITPEQHQEGIVFTEKAAQVASKIPETVTGESRAKSIELLVERNDINQANQNLLQQKQTTDVAYHAGIDQEIKTNEERIKKIDAEVYNIAKKPSKEFKDKEIIAATEVKPQPAEKIELAEVTEEVKPTEVKPSEENDYNTLYHNSSNENLKLEDIDLLRKGQSQLKRSMKDLPEELQPSGFYTTDDVMSRFMGGTNKYSFKFPKNAKVKDLAAEGRITDRLGKKELLDLRNQGYDIIKGKNMAGQQEFIPLNKDLIKDWKYEGPNIKKENGKYFYTKITPEGSVQIEVPQNIYESIEKNRYEQKEEVKTTEDIYFNKLQKSEKFDDNSSVSTYLGDDKGEKNIFYTLPNKGIISFKEIKNNTNRFSLTANAKNDKPLDIKNAFKRIEKFLPANHELIEDKSISVDGLRVWNNFIKNDKYIKTGETKEVEITPIDKTNLFKDLKYNTEGKWNGAKFENKDEALARLEKYLKNNNLNFKVKIDGDFIKVEVPVLKYNPSKEVQPTEVKEEVKTIEQKDRIPATYKTINIDEEIAKNNEIIKKGNTLDKSFAKRANNDLLKAKALGKKEYQSTEKPPKGYNLTTIGNKEYYTKQKELKPKVKEEGKAAKVAQPELAPIEAPKKTYQEAVKEKLEADKKRNREAGAERAIVTKEIYRRVDQMDAPADAEQVALRYLADGGKVSKEAVDEAYGSVKRAELNVKRRVSLSEEVKSKDFVQGNETLDQTAHRLWEANKQKIPESEIKDKLMAEIGNTNSRLEAAEAYLDKYNAEYKQEKEELRLAEQYKEQYLEEQAEIEKELRQPLDEQIEGEATEEHINNLIEQYEAEIKGEDQQLRPESEKEVSREAGKRKVAEKTSETELAKEYKEVVGKASKKAKENAKKEFVDRNFDNIVEKLKIQIKCPT